ncbi:MAG: efflux RND transporter periplasmic adaptor subunit [Acidobacteriota bacterium]|nr:efflux RND transporter periplasmic adaptor subunit [Acidobacteriota bacterium]
MAASSHVCEDRGPQQLSHAVSPLEGTFQMAKHNGKSRWIWAAAAIVIAVGISFAAIENASPSVSTPTALARNGIFTKYLELRGSVTALRSVTLGVPRVAGGAVRILTIEPTGSPVKAGDVVVTFDATQLKQTLEADQVTVKQDEAAVGKAKAAAQLKEHIDVTNLMKARFTLEQAKLEASKEEILSKIEGEEDQLAVADAQKAVLQAEQQLKSDRADSAATIQGAIQPLQKAKFDVRRTQEQIDSLTLKAPITGVVTIFKNPPWREDAPHFHPGDQVWPGQQIAEIPDQSTLRVTARVDEVDRGPLAIGQPVSVRVDAVPDRVFTGRIQDISTLTKLDFSGGWPFARNFEAMVELGQTDPRLQPGMTASLRIAASKLSNALLIPAAAAFQENGRTVAYVLEGGKFRAQPVEVSRPSDGQVEVLSGLRAGDRVALKAPAQKK